MLPMLCYAIRAMICFDDNMLLLLVMRVSADPCKVNVIQRHSEGFLSYPIQSDPVQFNPIQPDAKRETKRCYTKQAETNSRRVIHTQLRYPTSARHSRPLSTTHSDCRSASDRPIGEVLWCRWASHQYRVPCEDLPRTTCPLRRESARRD